jgi:hypothetical protein
MVVARLAQQLDLFLELGDLRPQSGDVLVEFR